MKRNMNKTVASQLPGGHEEDDQEGPAHKKLRRTNVKQTALKIVADVMKKYCTGTATKPAYAELEKEARNELKKGFQTPPIPIFTKVIHVTNMRNIWQWILDGTLQDVHPEDLNTHGRELKGPEDCRLSQKTTQQAPPPPPSPAPRRRRRPQRTSSATMMRYLTRILEARTVLMVSSGKIDR